MKRLTAFLLAILFVIPASAATTANSFITAQQIKSGNLSFTASSPSAGTFVTIYTGGPNGSRCFAFVATSTDSSGHNIQWAIYPQSATSPTFSSAVSLIATQGLLTPTQPLIAPNITPGLPVDQYGNQYIQLNPLDTIQVSWNTNTITNPLDIGIHIECSDF